MYKVKLKVQLEITSPMEYKIAEEFQETLKASGLDIDLNKLENPDANTIEVIKQFIKEDFEKTKGTKVNLISMNIEKDKQI